MATTAVKRTAREHFSPKRKKLSIPNASVCFKVLQSSFPPLIIQKIQTIRYLLGRSSLSDVLHINACLTLTKSWTFHYSESKTSGALSKETQIFMLAKISIKLSCLLHYMQALPHTQFSVGQQPE